MREISISPSLRSKFRRLQKKDTKLLQKIRKQIKLFSTNPKHPSLRVHKLEGNLKSVWSLSVTMNIRLLFVEDSTYYFFDMGTHDQVYKK
ncbi:MAG: type II toxin-antitoxin system mRNA interferase toxin, RelE/StbE family [Candidatus Pacebacteria bacterium CG_4_10_14_0_8_um_filter_42_14]|nr:MAG: type II toxin-antitoxin system mRNA interferase toxin, RelE/StbE family [Candidatus Pacebacteria bacterium CG_4_10_14_0_8_um_filter_42_14]